MEVTLTDLAERLHVVRDHLRTGRFGQREVWEEWLTEAAAEVERLRAVLQEMPDIIKDFDGGNPETSTGWASEEMLDLWMRVCRALEPKP